MHPHSLIVIAVFVWNAVLPDVQARSIVNKCSLVCAEERKAKSACVMERNCLIHMYSDNIEKFASCAEPCTKIGNCFQRCALGADLIKEECNDVCDGLSPCFDDCYNHRINQKMNTIFIKRP